MAGTNWQQVLSGWWCACVQVLKGAVKPVILAGPRLRSEHRRQAFTKLADASKWVPALLSGSHARCSFTSSAGKLPCYCRA
jgi:hypothetical protein